MAFADQSADFTLKVILVGDTSVGKSCLMERYLSGTFSVGTQTTVGVGYGAKTLEVGGHSARLQIWDTAGQEAYRSITRSFFRGSNAACVVYNLTSRSSFESIGGWVKELKSQSDGLLRVYLLANMSDLFDRREVDPKEGKALADKLAMNGFWEVSAKSGENVILAFDTIARETFTCEQNRRCLAESDASLTPKNHGTVTLSHPGVRINKGGCCK